MTLLPEHLDCGGAGSYYSVFFKPAAMYHQTGTCCYSLPVYGEHHLLYAPLDLVLRLQVSHVLCRLSVNSQDHVSNTEVGLGCFTPGSDLQHRRCHQEKATALGAVCVLDERNTSIKSLTK